MKVLFSNRADWAVPICHQLKNSIYTPVFAEFTEENFASADVVLPLSMKDVYTASRLLGMSNKGLFSPASLLSLADNKDQFNDFLVSSGFERFLPITGDQVNSYPCLIKGVKGVKGEFGSTTHLVSDESEEAEYRQALESGAMFKQEFVPGNFEYAVHFVAVKGEIQYLKEVEYQYNETYFIKGKNYKYSGMKFSSESRYHDELSAILSCMGYSGFGCFNYKNSESGELKIIELNPRIGGSMKGHIIEAIEAQVSATKTLYNKLV